MQFLPGQNFDCSGCARCCRAWNVDVDPQARAGLQGSGPALRVLQESGGPALVASSEGRWSLAKRDGSCCFLQEDRRCAVHAEMGGPAKPGVCLQFPFLPCQTPDGLVVGVSFYCPAIANNEGRPMVEHRNDLLALAGRVRMPVVGERVRLRGARSLTWAAYRDLEGWMQDGLERGQDPFLVTGAALLRLASVCLAEGPALIHDLAAPEGVGPLAEDGVLRWMHSEFAGGLVARVEAPGEAAAAFLEALRDNQPLEFPSQGWRGRPLEVESYRQACQSDWLGSELGRYLRALLFRKFLAQDRDLLENLVALHLVPMVATFYTHLSGLARGAPQPDRNDLYQALARLEYDLLTHGREAFAMTGSYTDFYLRRLGELLGGNPS